MYFLNHVRVNNNNDRVGLKVYTPVPYETLEDARKQLERTVEIIKKRYYQLYICIFTLVFQYC